jgi:hypothetical protein
MFPQAKKALKNGYLWTIAREMLYTFLIKFLWEGLTIL